MDLPTKLSPEKAQRSREAMERELEIARRIQASFLPDNLPQPEGWEIASRFEAAREVAGDFYDAFSLAGGKRIGLVVGDVCDKGVGAALFMSLFRSLIRAFADQHYSLGWMDLLASDAPGSNKTRSSPVQLGQPPARAAHPWHHSLEEGSCPDQ